MAWDESRRANNCWREGKLWEQGGTLRNEDVALALMQRIYFGGCLTIPCQHLFGGKSLPAYLASPGRLTPWGEVGGGYSLKIAIRVCAAQRGRIFGTLKRGIIFVS